MPTRLQLSELIAECSFQWTTLKATGPNGNSIFLPAAGYYTDLKKSLFGAGEKGLYWSASPYGNDRSRYMVLARMNNRDYWKVHTVNFENALSIRAVKVL